MKPSFKYIILILPFILSSCGINQVYTSASYGGLKSYIEKPMYNNDKITSTYASGSFRTGVFPQKNNENITVDDKTIAGNFSIHQSTSHKYLNYYYGIGGVFGNYKFNNDLQNHNSDLDNHFNKGENLNFYNIDLKTGVNFKRTWSKVDCNFIGIEFLYINEFGPYIDKLNTIKQTNSDVLIVDEKSFFAFNFNTEFTFRLNNDNNFGVGLYIGNLLLSKKQLAKTGNRTPSFSGLTFKYNHKKVTLSIVTEESTETIKSTHFGITYKIK